MTIEEKYKIHYVNGKRYYEVDLANRELSLENTTPYLFQYRDIQIQSGSWNRMAVAILTELDKRDPKTDEYLLSLKYYWSRTDVFSREHKTNFSPFRDLYLNTNHNSTHAVMNIQCILDAYGVRPNECFMLIRRHPAAEPKEAQRYFEAKTAEGFASAMKLRGFPQSKIDRVIRNFATLNQWLGRISKGFSNFFLFDNYPEFYNCKVKTEELIKSKLGEDSKGYELSRRFLDYYDDYFSGKDYYDKLAKAKIDPRVFEQLESSLEWNLMKKECVDWESVYYDVVVNMQSHWSDDSSFNCRKGLFFLAKCRFGDQYRFKNFKVYKFVNLKNSEFYSSTEDDLEWARNFACSKPVVTVAEINRACTGSGHARMGYSLKLLFSIANKMVRVSQEKFASKDELNLSPELIESIYRAFEKYISENTLISEGEFDNLSKLLPDIKYPWNPYLVFGITASYFQDKLKIWTFSDSTKILSYVIAFFPKQQKADEANSR